MRVRTDGQTDANQLYNLSHAVCCNYRADIYTVVHKKRDTFIFSITLANIDGFS